jgi:hypothetical protein
MAINVVFLFLRHSFANFGLLHPSIGCEDALKQPFADAHAGRPEMPGHEAGSQLHAASSRRSRIGIGAPWRAFRIIKEGLK